ncbi:MAG TPA: uroporphyrinogen-III synthase [Thermoanaerobaculia bacterium]|nr:uroporphyrinogen-III synthase [Thermoanaerobaculia bacterium]
MNPRPLEGVRVVVTRPVHQAGGLAAALEDLGARPEVLPLAEVIPPEDPEPLRRAAADLGRYSWIAFTSANAVHALLAAAGGKLPPQVRLAAVGDATADALRRRGLEPHRIAPERTGAGLAAELAAEAWSDAGEGVAAETPAAFPAPRTRPVLLPQAADARPELARGLAAAGVLHEAVVAYGKRLPPAAPARARELFPPGEPLGWVTFTSPRIVRAFAELVPDFAARRNTLRAASIGPTTSAALRRLGVEPAATAAEPSDRGLAAAVAGAVPGSFPAGGGAAPTR